MICHPDCLSESLIEMPEIVRRIVNSAGLHKEILAWQNQRLLEQFVRGPITILEEAIRWKQERAAGSSPMAGDLAHGVLAGRNALRGTPRSTAKAGQ
jgi:hypothetical protein